MRGMTAPHGVVPFLRTSVQAQTSTRQFFFAFQIAEQYEDLSESAVIDLGCGTVRLQSCSVFRYSESDLRLTEQMKVIY
jgi:predicted RNA methylase